jgi:hypothetical protein
MQATGKPIASYSVEEGKLRRPLEWSTEHAKKTVHHWSLHSLSRSHVYLSSSPSFFAQPASPKINPLFLSHTISHYLYCKVYSNLYRLSLLPSSNRVLSISPPVPHLPASSQSFLSLPIAKSLFGMVIKLPSQSPALTSSAPPKRKKSARTVHLLPLT